MLDWDRIRELRTEVGDDEFALILELFLDEVEGVIMRLSKGHPAQLATDLHFLKGCAWNLGFRGFGVLCDEGERIALTGKVARLNLDEVMQCYSSSKQMMIGALETEGALRRA
ncbi:Hpt domain-containing protein [Paracoccus shanxieyensis]|uniref:Hpt domain-containing protein n=1 Tax=Paracoccus shanxieyensis TaxID=2675752 RepID=A0A6L6IRC4_9RHOB|nr:Hpt domain-containing protein [Paracoccus shanxieyensis]MTH62703.1 Hpt domain-containing protein [Paracoccus shanxieyensis]MTH86213.1 Hpt domain-containing protein [Paracoccus shanxieyensis]